MYSKKWLGITAAAVVLTVCAAFGYLTRPQTPRAAKLGWVKQHNQDYDSYVIGSSAAAAYSAEELNQYLDAKFYNMSVDGQGAKDLLDSASKLLNHYEVKNLVLSLGLDEAAAHGVPEEKEEPSDSGYDWRPEDIEKIGALDAYTEAHGDAFSLTPGDARLPCIQECAQSVAKIRDLCDQNGVNLIVILSPAYCGQWSLYSEEALRAYETALAQEVDFWDFGWTSVSCDSRYFYDAGHFRSAVGTMVLGEIFDSGEVYRPEDFGTLVTAGTCQSHLDQLFSHPPVPDPADYTVDVPILLYHHIVEESGGEPNLTVESQAVLDQQLRWLAEEGYHAVTPQELIDYVYHGGDLPDKPVFITFDDGYYSNYSLAYPLLEQYGLKATIFAIGVSVGHMEYYKDTTHTMIPHFGYDEAREMQQSGIIDIQSHTYDMHQWPPYETGDQIRGNILPLEGESYEEYAAALRSDLAAYEQERKTELGAGFCALAYPEGRYCDWTEALIHQAGIPLTLSTRSDSRNILIRGLPQSLYALCRWYVKDDTTPEQLHDILQGT